MRPLLLLCLLPALALADVSRKPVIAVLPAKTTDAGWARFALVMEARAVALLLQAQRHSVLDTKQVLAMANQEGLGASSLSDDANADTALKLLGADRVVTVVLTPDGAGLTISGTVRDGAQATPFSVKGQGGLAALLSIGSEAIARAALEKEGATLAAGVTAQPESKSNAAVIALGTCWEVAQRQPMGLDAPVGLSSEELSAAVDACRAALKADGSLRFAAATLALLLAIAREDAEAEKVLGAPAATDPALMPWAQARFWLATRNQSNEAAVTFLDAVLKQHPGALMFRSFKGNTLSAMNEQARAVSAWNEYLSLAPASAFAQGRLSRALARQEKFDLALAAAKTGLSLVPTSREARVVLGARQIDAGKLKDAKVTLEPLLKLADAPAEPMLHLALALLAANDCKTALPLFQSASERAAGGRGLRVKGRALYGLAVCEVKQGHADAAKAAYTKSLETGYVVGQPDPALVAMVKSAGPVSPAPAPVGGLYLHLDPGASPSPETAQLADKALHAKLDAFAATYAPADEDKKAALAAMKANHLKGYELRMSLEPGEAANALKVQLLVMSYPEHALKGSWSVKAAGGKPEKLIAALVNRVIDDAAGDLEWKN